MAQVLIRNLDEGIVQRLKRRAEREGRSLQAELRYILEHAAKADRLEARRVAARIRRKLANRSHSDSGRLLSEDRER
jgi:plasmid stability protein